MENERKLLIYPWFYRADFRAEICGGSFFGHYIICSRRGFADINVFVKEKFKKSSFIKEIEVTKLSPTEKSVDYSGKYFCKWYSILSE